MTETLRVLMVEDSASDAKLVVRALQRTGRPVDSERVETAEAMRAALERKRWDLVTSDWSMPKFTAPAALAILRENDLDIPFIIVSGTVGEASAVEAMRAGAKDYVLKDNISRLAPAVDRELLEWKNRRARREAELGRREAEQRSQRIVDSAMVGMWTLDAAGKTTFMNARMASILCLELDKALRTPPIELFPKEDRAAIMARLGRRESKLSGQFEQTFRRGDGSVGRLAIESGPMHDAEGRFEGVLCIVTDITQRLQLEEQLRQSQKMEAIGRLAGGVAHDFNNVLSVILSYGAMLLAEMKPGDPMRDDVEEIYQAGKRANGLTRQLLMFSRQQVLEPKVLDLNEVLASMDKMLQRILGADVDLVSLPTRRLGHVRADRSSIEQVIMNLVVNARDAMPTGGKLTLETGNVTLDEAYAAAHLGVKPGPHVVLAVMDTGSGMDKATQTRIFDPFFTTKPSGKGTGLGLSTVFGIAQQSGGSIWVYSEPGKGTTFKVYFPRVDTPVDTNHPSEPPLLLRGSETILLVEDDDQVRAVTCGILRKNGYHVIEARNAGEAILQSEKHTNAIQLLLSDVVMPQMSGPELAKRLVKARPDMRVLCMSGYTDDSIVRHGVLEAKMAYLQKPITPDALTRRVREVLDATSKRGKA